LMYDAHRHQYFLRICASRIPYVTTASQGPRPPHGCENVPSQPKQQVDVRMAGFLMGEVFSTTQRFCNTNEGLC
jgi:hypothetical protein